VSGGSSLTEAMGTAALAGVIALSGTNLHVQRPIDAFGLYYVTPSDRDLSDVLKTVTSPSAVPTSGSSFVDIEASWSDSRWVRLF